jgi:hypothetical protein
LISTLSLASTLNMLSIRYLSSDEYSVALKGA